MATAAAGRRKTQCCRGNGCRPASGHGSGRRQIYVGRDAPPLLVECRNKMLSDVYFVGKSCCSCILHRLVASTLASTLNAVYCAHARYISTYVATLARDIARASFPGHFLRGRKKGPGIICSRMREIPRN